MTPVEPLGGDGQIRRWWLPLVVGAPVVVLLAIAVAFGIGRCSAPDPVVPTIIDDVDASAGEAEIAARLDAAVRAEDERLAELERTHAAEIAALEAADRREYEEQRARGRHALAVWFKERTARLLADAGARR